PEGPGQVRGAPPGGDARRPVLRDAGCPLHLRGGARGQVRGEAAGGGPEGPLRPRPRLPGRGGEGRDPTAPPDRRWLRGVPDGRGAPPGGHRAALFTPPRPDRGGAPVAPRAHPLPERPAPLPPHPRAHLEAAAGRPPPVPRRDPRREL